MALTREEMLALDGAELDKAVAEAMGGKARMSPLNDEVCMVQWSFVSDWEKFTPHRDMNYVRKIIDWITSDSERMDHFEYWIEKNGRGRSDVISVLNMQPSDYCRALLEIVELMK